MERLEKCESNEQWLAGGGDNLVVFFKTRFKWQKDVSMHSHEEYDIRCGFEAISRACRRVYRLERNCRFVIGTDSAGDSEINMLEIDKFGRVVFTDTIY